LRDLSLSLGRVGDLRRDGGDREGALAAQSEALELARRIIATYGQTRQAVSDLVFSLEQTASALDQLGRTAEAGEVRQEAAAISARL
jgi:hypothetical protein